jgi:hypothetical protein
MRTIGRVLLLTRDDLGERHLDSRGIARRVDAGHLRVVRPGIFADLSDGARFTTEEWVLARAAAWDMVARDRPVFSHTTAAVAHQCPLYRDTDARVHVILPPERPGPAKGLVRHRGEVPDAELVEVHGMLFTTLERTVADVARTSPFATAVCIADAALRAASLEAPGRYRQDRADTFRQNAAAIMRRSAHGQRRATRVLAFADGRAQLPGESVSRIHLIELGFALPRLQVRVPGPHGTDYWVDFGLDDVLAFGEFDGKAKYRDPLLRRGLTMAQVLEKEKQREDWIRGTTQRRLARWGSEHIRTAAALGDRLASFGIIPPRSPRLRR